MINLCKTSVIILSLIISISIFPQQNESWKLFDDSQVARVDITIDPASIEWLYNHVNSDSEFVAQFHFQNAYINDSIDSIGFRLRGNSSRDAAKKSFKISFDTYIKGREFYGVDKLNLNGEHNDPSIIRSKLCFDFYNIIGMNASRANHTEVYINGQYFGLYISVEHIDDEFLKKNYADASGNLWKCLYPADLFYIGLNPDLYKNLTNDGRPVYELMTNKTEADFSELAHLIAVINNTPIVSFVDSMESVIDVPGVLKYFAMNVLVGEWDDYWSLNNNYYLYHEPKKDIFHLIPYDYDNTFGIDWFNIDWTNSNPYAYPKVVNGYRPLAEKIMMTAQYRNLYTHFLEFYSQNVFMLSHWEDRLDSLKNMITQSAISDSFRTFDYGFNTNDFFNSYSSTGYSKQHVKYGIKQFVNLKNSQLPSLLSYQNAKPIVYKIDYSPENPGPQDSIHIIVSAFDNDGLSEVSIHYIDDDSAAVQIYPMVFSPVTGTKIVENTDRWTGTIPPLGNNQSGKFLVYVLDTQNQSMTFPRKKPISLTTARLLTDNIVINELMADNLSTIADPDGEYDDWIELYNPTGNQIPLTGKYLTDKKDNLTKWKFKEPGLFMAPNEYLLVWCDEDSGQAGLHTNFKLSTGGEFVALVNNDGVTVIDSISFGSQTTDVAYGRVTDAGDNWAFITPTPGSTNNPTSVNDDNLLPLEFSLHAYPNPFNPSTTILYNIPLQVKGLENSGTGLKQTDNKMVTLKIYDILGNEIRTLVNEEKSPGIYNVTWNGLNNSAKLVSSGIYFARLNINDQFKNLKLMLIK